MKYSKDEVMQYVAEEDVKFIRMAFCDVYGKQKNISIMPSELKHAFEYGISVDASSVSGFDCVINSDLLLHPDPSTISVLPWRPEHGRVVRMFCSVTYPDGTPFEADTRSMLANAAQEAKKAGISFKFGSEIKFYLFCRDENGNPTKIPYDNAGYMDIAPEDKGENVRREICLTLEQMGIRPETSHHEEGPGQNEINFRCDDPVAAADNAVTFRSVVDTIAARNGLYADFSPKPLENSAYNSLHIHFSAESSDGSDVMPSVISGVLDNITDMTVFLNTCENSYKRFGSNDAPKQVSYGENDRSKLIRIPAAKGEYRRAELRSPDPQCNPYVAFTLIIKAGLSGIKNGSLLSDADESNASYLPDDLSAAKTAAAKSDFIANSLPKAVADSYTK